MSNGRDVQISRDAQGNLIVTGDGNVFYLMVAEPSEARLAQIRTGEVKLAEMAEAIPLPTLTLAIAFESDQGTRWRITAERPKTEPADRITDVPWLDKPEFASAFGTFWELSRRPLEKEEERRALEAAAKSLGNTLAEVLIPQELELLREAARGDPPPPLLVIESDDDLILALPWELLRIDDGFVVADGRLDVARSLPAKGAPLLGPPKEPVTLLVNVSAPEGSGLDYEAESYAITRALHDHVGVRVNELGELGDLISGLRDDPAPIGVHFSGHGGPGTLVFEDQFGDADSVPVHDLLTEIRKSAPKRFPRFFYLACCHGGDPPALTKAGPENGRRPGLSATATALHRDGVTQVVGYFGPVYDILSTWAEGAFYGEIGKGRRTRDALRVARDQMTRPLELLHRAATRDAEAPGAGAGNPFAWAQLVLYQRGPDHPLGTAVPRQFAEEAEAKIRRVVESKGERSRLLRTGFVGRRMELHRLRRDLYQGKTIHVVQGLGGIGKSALCGEALKLYQRQGRELLYLWCAEVEGVPDPVGGLLQQLSGQLEARFGELWNAVVATVDRMVAQQPALERPAPRLVAYLSLLLQQPGVPPLVAYLDNLESLQRGPETAEETLFGAWRDHECAMLWLNLAMLARNSGGRLALLASGRYQHDDYVGELLPIKELPDDAVWRLFGWFEALRGLAPQNRARLVEQLAGHPRAVEFLDGLVNDALLWWKRRRGARPPALNENDAAREWTEIVEPELPTLEDKLSENLLFGALWQRVLNQDARDLLLRTTVLRRPADWDLLVALASSPDAADAAIELLRRSSLLTEIQEGEAPPRFEVHPNVAALSFAQVTAQEGETSRQEGHMRAGEFLKTLAVTSPDWGDNLEAAYHLAQVGEDDRAWNLLRPLAEWLLARGRLLDSLAVTAQLTDLEALSLRVQGQWGAIQAKAWIGLGDLESAERSLWQSAERLQQLLDENPAEPEALASLAVTLVDIGDLQSAKGQLDAALHAYQESHAIRMQLAERDPDQAESQRFLSVSFERIGNVQRARGNLDAAFKAYGDSHAIREKLAAQDPSNAEWQRDLSVSFNKIGDVQRARGNLEAALKAYQTDLAIAEKLTTQDPSNSEWQRDLSVSFDRIGDVQRARGDLDAALEAYQDSLTIRERLAAPDPSNSEWQRDLSVSFNKIGNVQRARGDLDAALKAYQDSLAIAEKLAAQDPSNSEWQRDVWASMWCLAELEGGGVSWTEVLEKLEAMKARGVLLPTDEPFLEQARAQAAQ